MGLQTFGVLLLFATVVCLNAKPTEKPGKPDSSALINNICKKEKNGYFRIPDNDVTFLLCDNQKAHVIECPDLLLWCQSEGQCKENCEDDISSSKKEKDHEKHDSKYEGDENEKDPESDSSSGDEGPLAGGLGSKESSKEESTDSTKKDNSISSESCQISEESSAFNGGDFSASSSQTGSGDVQDNTAHTPDNESRHTSHQTSGDGENSSGSGEEVISEGDTSGSGGTSRNITSGSTDAQQHGGKSGERSKNKTPFTKFGPNRKGAGPKAHTIKPPKTKD